MTQIQTASVAAVPQQVARNGNAAGAPQTPSMAQTLSGVADKLEASTQAGDRDAQEQYLGNEASQKKNQNRQESTPENEEPAPPSMWNLAVADDSLPSDLDIRG